MKRSWNTIFQVIAATSQAINLYTPIMPPKWQLWATAGISIAQGTIGVLAQSFNPDGTSAALPYVPPQK